MSNMGYCRFQNTLKDLRDCAEALDYEGGVDSLSEDEQRAARQLIALCYHIHADWQHETEAQLKTPPYNNLPKKKAKKR